MFGKNRWSEKLPAWNDVEAQTDTDKGMSAYTGKARCDGGLSLYAEMESCLVLVAEGYFAFKHLAQFGGKTKDQQIQR